MSLKAMAWAIDQHCGSPSAKVTLWAIANHAGETTWVTWASQALYAEETEQSPDSVQRRIPELEARGLIKRFPLRYDGRKSTDLYMLRPSPYWSASIEEIEKLLPRGLSIDPRFAAQYDPADCGHVETVAEQPQTLPQPAENVAALVRQQEPGNKPENLERDARARDPEKPEEGADAIPDRPLLDRLIALHPQSAHDRLADIATPWLRLSREERRMAVERFPAWLAARGKRQAIAGLPTYLGDRMFLRVTAPPAPGESLFVAPFSAAWWRLWLDAFAWADALPGRPLRDRNSAETAALRDRAERARKGLGWKLISPERRVAAEEAAKALVAVPKNGAAAEAWQRWFHGRGVALPSPDRAEWIFMPAEWPSSPPNEAAGGMADEAAAVLGMGRP